MHGCAASWPVERGQMSKGSIGIMCQGLPPAQTLEAIVRADVLGVPTWWAGSGRVGPDALTLFGAAAARTKSIRLGTAIVPMYPRHPFVVAQQAQVISNLAPGRLVLGVGPGAGPTITESFGILSSSHYSTWAITSRCSRESCTRVQYKLIASAFTLTVRSLFHLLSRSWFLLCRRDHFVWPGRFPTEPSVTSVLRSICGM